MWAMIIIWLLTGLGLLLAAVTVYSYIRTAGGTRYDLAFDEPDRFYQPGAVVKRRFKGPGHLLHRLMDTLGYGYPVLRVYVFRMLSPKFREKIMITTAMANRCEH